MKQKTTFMLAVAILFSCTGKRSEFSESETENKLFLEAVCMKTNAPLYDKPSAKGQVINSLQLGDIVEIYVSEEKISDGISSEFYAIHLSSNIRAWISADNLLIDGIPAAVIQETHIFEQPESRAQSNQRFFLAEFVAIKDKADTWVMVTGAGKIKKGWVPAACISTNPGDVNIAVLAHSDLLDKNGKLVPDKLAGFLRILPDKNFPIAVKLQKMMDKEVADAIMQSIMDYEEEYYDMDIQIED